MSTGLHHVVITGVRNHTHVLYQASYLRELLAEYPAGLSVSFVTGGRMLGAAGVDPDALAALIPADDRLQLRLMRPDENWVDRGVEELSYLSVGAPGIKPWLRLRSAAMRRRINVVVSDEGLGSYGNWQDGRAAYRRQGGGPVWSTVRSLAVSAGNRLLTTKRWALHRPARLGWHRGGWELTPPIVEEFLRHARRDLTKLSSQVVLVTQPWVELGVLTQAEHAEFVGFIERLVEELGLELVIRPHPAEHEQRYRGIAVLAGKRPAECEPTMVNAAAVIGGPSTALINLAALHQVPTIRYLPEPVARIEQALSPAQRSILQQYTGSAVAREGLAERLWAAISS